MTASTCSKSAMIGVRCLLAAAEEFVVVVEAEGERPEEYSLILLSPECFKALPFALQIAAIFLNCSLFHTVSLPLDVDKAGVSGEGAYAKPIWADGGLFPGSLFDEVVGAGEGKVGDIKVIAVG